MSSQHTTKGQCLCGSVRVTVTAPKPLTSFPTLTCHCTNCKRRSGGIASYAFLVPKEHVSITGDSHKTYSDPDTGSGKPMQRSLCTECGSPVTIVEGSSPEIRCLQYGLFAGEVELPRPGLELFARERVGWVPEVGEDVRETA